MNTDIFVTYLNALGIIALLTIAYSHVARQKWEARTKSVVLGLVFGLGALVTMAVSLELQPGLIIDGRTIVIALGAALGGLPAAIISSVIAGIYRVFLGGTGVPPGLLSIVIASALGVLWYNVGKARIPNTWLSLGLLSMASPLSLIAAFVLPWQAAVELLELMFLPNLLSSLGATAIVGAQLEQENRLAEKEKQLRYRASVDGLTGLVNRAEFDARVSRRLKAFSNERASVALLIIDVDHFKSVNDRFGHATGDEVLIQIARILQDCICPQDFAARLGGEEFAIVIDTRSPNRAIKTAENIRAVVENKTFASGSRQFRVTVSVGCTVAKSTETLESIYSRADAALYYVKNHGRNSVHSAEDVAPQDAA